MSILRGSLAPVGVALISAVVGFLLYQWFETGGAADSVVQETESSSAVAVIGAPLPHVALPDPAGRPRTLLEWQGRPMLINFWATWCSPCRKEVPELIELQREFGDRGLVVVGIALDEPERIRRFIRDFGIDYPVLVESGHGTRMNAAFGNRLGVLPYTVYVDAAGVIREVHKGALTRDQGRESIRRLFES